MAEMAPLDADMFWRSRLGATDQFALYCFAAQGDRRPDELLADLRLRAGGVPELGLRVAPAWRDLALPRWCPAPIVDDQLRHHDGPATWDECRAAVADLLTDSLDATEHTWRAHLFGPVAGAPRAAGPAWVLVLQVSHALADGRGVAALARTLLGPGGEPEPTSGRPVAGDRPGVPALAAGVLGMPLRLAAGLALGTAGWRRADDTPAPPTMAATTLNRVAGRRRRIDVRVVEADALRIGTATVTVSVLARLAEVLGPYLGIADDALTVELTVGRAAHGRGRNNFHNVSVRLHPHLDRIDRARMIDAQIRAARVREDAPGRRLERRAADITPAVLRSLAVRWTPTDVAPARVAGAAVVSAVHRGPADLTLGGGAVLFTAGFPALSSAHALSIGVHRLGATATLSLTTDPAAVDADCLVSLLVAATDG